MDIERAAGAIGLRRGAGVAGAVLAYFTVDAAAIGLRNGAVIAESVLQNERAACGYAGLLDVGYVGGAGLVYGCSNVAAIFLQNAGGRRACQRIAGNVASAVLDDRSGGCAAGV